MGPRLLSGERAALRARRAEFEQFEPDVVVDSICFEPARAEDLVALFSAARRVVLISTADVYGEDVGCAPVTEARTPEPVSAYARAKPACERVVLEGLGSRATVFRPSHILGRTFLTASLWGRSAHLVDRIRRGLLVPAIDGG
jgi:nucleoside-diphosphate-sugar epimerase